MSKAKKIKKNAFGVHFDPYNHPKRTNKNISRYEVTFDESSRKEFVTGFRARKMQRRKIAEQALQEKARLERIEARKARKEAMMKALAKMRGEDEELDPDIDFDKQQEQREKAREEANEGVNVFGDLDDAEGNSMPKVQHGPSARPEDFESDDDDDDGDDDDNDNGDTFGERVYETETQMITTSIQRLDDIRDEMSQERYIREDEDEDSEGNEENDSDANENNESDSDEDMESNQNENLSDSEEDLQPFKPRKSLLNSDDDEKPKPQLKSILKKQPSDVRSKVKLTQPISGGVSKKSSKPSKSRKPQSHSHKFGRSQGLGGNKNNKRKFGQTQGDERRSKKPRKK